MKNRILWTTAALLTTAVGVPLSSYAQATKVVDVTLDQNRQTIPAPTVPIARTANVVKVGEYQSPNQDNAVIARIEAHTLRSKLPAATLYVKNIPVITFVEQTASVTPNLRSKAATNTNTVADTAVWRATQLAAKLNQLNLNGVDASKITVAFKAGNSNAAKNAVKQNNGDRYAIKVDGEQLVEINAQTRLPDPTNDLAEDALQAANRLRRLLGNAPPLTEITGRPLPLPKLPQAISPPKLPKQIAVGPIKISLRGIASWYGPGFHGNRSASGERFNQNALTAAHRHLPFGTKVKVTNMRNGRSVVVRINDRGPFTRGRIIDLSAGAARVIGVMQSGVAPVRVDVLNNPRSTSTK